MIQSLMNQYIGKIIFYNVNEGSGIILTEQKEKFPFEVVEWDDFDNTPEVGMLVSFKAEKESALGVIMHTQEIQSEAVHDQEEYEVVDELLDIVTHAEVLERPSKIPLDKNVTITVREYFMAIEKNIQERTNFQASKMRLDFLRIRRFLFTTYNNLTELDTTFITTDIKKIRDDLIQMSRVYDDYKVKTTYPDVAFDKIFLSQQSMYIEIRKESELTFSDIQKMRISEQFLSRDLEEREEVLKTVLRSSTQFIRLKEEYKNVKGQYVDAVHMLASLESSYREDLRLLSEFEKEYQAEFFDKFAKASKKYRKQILFILDAQAFAFDAQLWRQAKKSKVIQRFFRESHITGEYCAKTYLRYYLNTLDPQKVSKEQNDLFELLKYLEAVEHKTALGVFKDIDDALRVKFIVSKLPFDMEVEIFTDEKKALIWAEQNSYNIIIISDILESMYGSKLVEKLCRRSKVTSNIIMIGESGQNQNIKLSKILPLNFRDKELTDTISKLFDDKGNA